MLHPFRSLRSSHKWSRRFGHDERDTSVRVLEQVHLAYHTAAELADPGTLTELKVSNGTQGLGSGFPISSSGGLW